MREDVKMSRCERRCEDEKMFYRPPLLEEPCAQTLSGKERTPTLRGFYLVAHPTNRKWVSSPQL